MVTKKSKPVALDRRDMNSLFYLLGGYPVLILGIIATLSVCAAFVIYRTVKGQRRKRGKIPMKKTESEVASPVRKTKREENDYHAAALSTGGCDEKAPEVSLVEPSEATILLGTDKSTEPCAEVSDEDQGEMTEEFHSDPLPEPFLSSYQDHVGDHADDYAESPNMQSVYEVSDQPEREGNECLKATASDEEQGETIEEVHSDPLPEQCLSIKHHYQEGVGCALGQNVQSAYEFSDQPEREGKECLKVKLSDEDLGETTVDVQSDPEQCLRLYQDDHQDHVGDHSERQRVQSAYEVSGQIEHESKGCLKEDITDTEEHEVESNYYLGNHRESENTHEGCVPNELAFTSKPQEDLQEHLQNSSVLKEVLSDPHEGDLTAEPEASPSTDSNVHLEADDKTKMDDVVATINNRQEDLGNCYTQVSDFESCFCEQTDLFCVGVVSGGNIECMDEQTKSKQDHNWEMDASTSQMKDAHDDSEKKVASLNSCVSAQLEESHEKTEINIMEATMDNNEWLSVCGTEGNEDFTGVPQSDVCAGCSAEVEQSHQERQDDTGVADTPKEPKVTLASLEEDHGNKRVATVLPMPQTVSVSFCVHYITHSPSQLLAVTGNQQELGGWESFAPLKRAKDGFWANTITLPIESQMEWKFVLVENCQIQCWEECSNRHLVVADKDEYIHLHKWWGCL